MLAEPRLVLVAATPLMPAVVNVMLAMLSVAAGTGSAVVGQPTWMCRYEPFASVSALISPGCLFRSASIHGPPLLASARWMPEIVSASLVAIVPSVARPCE